MTHGKRYAAAVSLVDTKKVYSLAEAVDLIKKTGTAKFDATVELHTKLGIDPKKGEQQVRGTVSLPHGTGKTKKVAAFVNADKAKDAKDAGADFVGGEDLIEELAKTEKIDFDIAIATPDMMPKLAKVAKILGPKGLMPNPKTDTVGTNVKKMVEDVKKGKVSFKNDDTSNVHMAVGKVSFSVEQLTENISAAVDALKRAKPASAKGAYMNTATMSTTMGPGIRFFVV